MTSALLQVEDLCKHFPIVSGVFARTTGWIKAVDGIDLSIARGETLGLVGESGCGKTTLGRMIARLIDPTRGSIRFDGRDVSRLDERGLRDFRRSVQIVFQNPYGALNPRMTVEEIVSEPLLVSGERDAGKRRRRAIALLERVGLQARHAGRYPHAFSGGQRQRICIARALAMEPALIVCDEPVSALDVSIRSQIVNLLQDLQDEFGLAYLFISHDLSIVRHVSDRIAVMYLGRVVEAAPADELFARPAHPYTKALLAASPVPDPAAVQPPTVLEGGVPSPAAPPPGCHFAPRCAFAEPRCRAEPAPALEAIAPAHHARCWRARELGSGGG